MYMNFISPNNQKQNIIVLKNETKRKNDYEKKYLKDTYCYLLVC